MLLFWYIYNMNTVLIIFLLLTGCAMLVLAFIQIQQKYKAYKKSEVTVEILKECQIEAYRKFAEACLFDSGFDLDNVYIAPNISGGIIFRHKTNALGAMNFTAKNLDRDRYRHLSNTFEYGTIYMILPEITSLNSVWTWLHEIGHYMCQHLDDKRPDFIHEYEAEKYAETFIKQCPVVKGPSYYPEYTINVHNIHLQYCINNAKAYVKTFIDKQAVNNAYALDLYMDKHIDEYVNTNVEIPML